MNKILRRDQIIKAVRAGDHARIDALVAMLVDAERTREILNKKGWGLDAPSLSKTAVLVPERVM